MSVQEVVIRAQRTEELLAVQFVPGDAHREAVIRGWTKIPDGFNLDNAIGENSWVLKRDDGHVYVITNEQFTQDFAVVLEVSGG